MYINAVSLRDTVNYNFPLDDVWPVEIENNTFAGRRLAAGT